MNDIMIKPQQQPYQEVYPGITNGIDYLGIDTENPWISSPNAEYDLYFAQTRETLLDVEVYKSFLSNSIRRFRSSKYYKTYKSYLMGLGLDHCAILGNVQDGMANIEMHHNFLTIYDIALMITEHVINTVGMITTFDLIQLLIEEHWANRIPIVMLSETEHQKFHSDQDSFIPPQATFGKWWELIYKYRYGITINIAQKIIQYIDRCNENPMGSLFVNMRNDILSFSNYNEYGYPVSKCVTINQIEAKPELMYEGAYING